MSIGAEPPKKKVSSKTAKVPMLINGENYADWLWLKLSDMFVITSLLMLVAGIGAVCFGATRYIRKKN